MQIQRLRLMNFRQHENTELDFGPGLTGIIGPNGSGKTTLLEAIAWVMYGTKAARGTRETLRRRGAPPRSRVEVEMAFSLGAHQYRIVRSLNSAELYQDGGADPVANSLDAVTESVTRLLGMSREEFFNTYFTGQKELAVMASMNGSERAQFLSRVLGYDRIRVAQERLREGRTALRTRLKLLDEALRAATDLDARLQEDERRLASSDAARAEAERTLALATARLNELEPRWREAETARERFLRLQGERGVAEADVTNRREAVERLRRDAAAAVEARREIETLEARLVPLAALRAEARALDERARAASLRRQAVAQRDAARSRLEEIARALRELPGEDDHARVHERVADVRRSSEALVAKVDDLRTSQARDQASAQSSLTTLIAQFEDLEHQRERIATAGPAGVCPTCARPLGEEFEQVLALLDRQLEEVRSNGKYFRGRVNQLAKGNPELETLEAERRNLETDMSRLLSEQGRMEAGLAERGRLRDEEARLTARLPELEAAAGGDATVYDVARHDAVKAQIAELEPVLLRAERRREQAARADALRADAEAASASLEARMKDLERLSGEITAVAFDAGVHEQLRQANALATEARRNAELAQVRATSEHEAAAAALETTRARLGETAARRRERSETATRLLLHDELDRAFTDLRTDLNQTLRPELSELASGFVRDLTNGRYTELELDEDYLAKLLEDGDLKPVISGGEEDVANLALRLAISQMIADRAGQPLSLLVLDEIFGSLDEERRGAVVELLRSLSDRFPQVILITHIETVREGFDRIIRVGFDAARGVAIVSEEPGGADIAA
jgi:exonuclease SbcC